MKVNPKLLIAEGDSWFAYPKSSEWFDYDILDRLEDKGFNYEILHDAHYGDTLKKMATDKRQRRGVRSLMKRLRKKQQMPAAILLSGGGNDVVRNLKNLINRRRNKTPILNISKTDAYINGELYRYYITIINNITSDCRKYFGNPVPILVHGYGHVVPDGRGKRDSDLNKVGWIKKVFDRKGHKRIEKNTAAAEKLMNIFNDMVASLPKKTGFEHVRYVDFRPCLSNELYGDHYKCDWRDELHLAFRGLKKVARKFDKEIRALHP